MVSTCIALLGARAQVALVLATLAACSILLELKQRSQTECSRSTKLNIEFRGYSAQQVTQFQIRLKIDFIS